MEKAWLTEEALEAWEGEGGAVLPAEKPLVGTVNPESGVKTMIRSRAASAGGSFRECREPVLVRLGIV